MELKHMNLEGKVLYDVMSITTKILFTMSSIRTDFASCKVGTKEILLGANYNFHTIYMIGRIC